jgi:serine/threonine-protein kinase
MDGASGFEKLLVIKKIREELASDAEFVARFQDEARTLVQLEHGAIARVFDMGEVGGIAYIALEFVDGKDLKAVLQRCQERGVRMPTALALQVMLRVLEALAYAHRKRDDFGRELNLVHRDVSPPNVLIGYDGEVKIIDFGLAKSVLSAQRTQAGALVGKFAYMAPEAARHQPLDRRADLFGVGVVLHEVLNGRHVLEGLAAGELLARAVKPAYPRLAGQVPGVTPALDAVLQQALAADPSRRFQSAEEMIAPLADCLAELAPNLGPEAVARFMQSLFAAEYAQERSQLRMLRDPSWVGRAVPSLGQGVAASGPTFISAPRDSGPTLRRYEIPTDGAGFATLGKPQRPSSGSGSEAQEYELPQLDDAAAAPPAAGEYADPSMAPTFYEPVEEARPDTAPSPAVRRGPVDPSAETLRPARSELRRAPPRPATDPDPDPSPGPPVEEPELPPTRISVDAFVEPEPATQFDAAAEPDEAPTPAAPPRKVEQTITHIGEDDDSATQPGTVNRPRPRSRWPLIAAGAGAVIAAGLAAAWFVLHAR